MNILLVRPKPHRESIGLQSFMICEPLELEYLAALVEPLGHRVRVVDMILEKTPFPRIVSAFQPDVVGFTGYITHVGVIKAYARETKAQRPETVTVAGGVHAEVVPGDFEDDAIDLIVHVNGCASFREIVDARTRGLSADRIRREVPGVWDGPGKRYPGIAPPVDLPFPDREKTRAYRNRYNYIFHDRCAIMKTSFGCPYRCDFCFCTVITRHAYVERDLDDVMAEMRTIRERNIFIVDDCFLLNPERVRAFCDRLERDGVRKNFILFGRADFIVRHPALVQRFGRLGLRAVFMGLESFREQELADLNKSVTVQQNVEALHILEQCGIECHCGMIAGPDWTRADFDVLIRWIRSFKMLFVNLQPLTPMPGTPLYDRLKDRITVGRDRFPEWDMAHLVVDPRNLSRRRFYGNILRAYYRTSAGLRAHGYIARKYGRHTYLRTLWGSLFITLQYIRLWMRG